ncbi:MAG: hypothetical protein ACK58T_16195, partial [Phycisphaerae bacterium]
RLKAARDRATRAQRASASREEVPERRAIEEDDALAGDVIGHGGRRHRPWRAAPVRLPLRLPCRCTERLPCAS